MRANVRLGRNARRAGARLRRDDDVEHAEREQRDAAQADEEQQDADGALAREPAGLGAAADRALAGEGRDAACPGAALADERRLACVRGAASALLAVAAAVLRDGRDVE